MASPYQGGSASPPPPHGTQQGSPFAARPAAPGSSFQQSSTTLSGAPSGSPSSFQPSASAAPGYGAPQQAGFQGPPSHPSYGSGFPGSAQAPYASPQRPGGPIPVGASAPGGDGFRGRAPGPLGAVRPGAGPPAARPAFPGAQGGPSQGMGGGPGYYGGQMQQPGPTQFAQPQQQQQPGAVRPPGMAGPSGFPGARPGAGPPPQPVHPGGGYGPRPGGPPPSMPPLAGQQQQHQQQQAGGYSGSMGQLVGQVQQLQVGTGAPPSMAQQQQQQPQQAMGGASGGVGGPPLGGSGGPPRRVYPQAQAYTTGAGAQPPQQYGPPPGMTTLAPPAPARMASQPRTPPSHIDPTQIPRPQPADAIAVFETRVGGTANLPPPATSSYLVRDTGNCSPRVMRATLNQVPTGEDLVKTSGMPLALLVTPLALGDPREEAVPVVDTGEAGPVRCGRCKAYINPFMTFTDQGRHFICNFCHLKNETPRDYVTNLGPDGRRRDVLERPELCRGSVEFVATKEYMVRPPMPHTLLFLIDVSLNAVATGSTAACCSAVARALAELPDSAPTRVGIATFDSTIHFYNLNPSLAAPQMLIVPDVKDPYTPLPSGLAVPLASARQHLGTLLDSLPSMFQSNRVGDSAMGSAVKAAVLALRAQGGKVLVFQAVLPSLGIASLSAREAEGRAGPAVNEKEVNKLLQPADKALETLAMEAAEFQVGVDVFVTAQGYCDVASLSVLPRITGGSLYSYQPFNPATDSAKLYNDLRWNLTRPQGLEAVLRVRCSQGLQVSDYSGHFCRRIPTDVDLPVVDCDKALLVTLRHEEKLSETNEAAFQCALLYTTPDGQRRIRVHTLQLPVTAALGNLFRGADLDAHFAYFLKTAAADVSRVPITQIRDGLTSATVAILHAYRKHCATSSSAGQLILPEALKLLPLYMLALTKSPGLRADLRCDERAYWLAKVACLPVPLAVPLVYPRMFAVHALPPEGTPASALPPVVALSSEKLEAEGVYLVENGEDAFLWAGKAVSPDVVTALFGVHSLDQVAPGQLQLTRLDSPLSQQLNNLVDEIRRQRCSYLRLRILKRGDPLEPAFFQSLVEDKAPYGQSYVEYLIHIHRQIQNKFN